MLSAQEQEWLSAVYGLPWVVNERQVTLSVDGQELALSLTIGCEDPEAIELLAFPLLYTFANLSFCEARPMGTSEMVFSVEDSLSLPEFLQTLGYEQGCLTWYGDYIKGRRVKTELRILPIGELKVQTFGRGLGPDFWVRLIQGEKPLQVVPSLETS